MYDSFDAFLNDRATGEKAQGAGDLLSVNELPPVPTLDRAMLPQAIGDYVWDIAGRQGSPHEFVAVSLLVAFGSVLGNGVTIAPRALHDWTVVPTNWAMLIGEPSAMKSPSMRAGLMPIEALQRELDEAHELESDEQAAMRELSRLHAAEMKARARDAIRQGDHREAYRLLQQCVHHTETPRPRLTVEDISEARLVQVLSENPYGLLGVHDEFTGLLSRLTQRSGNAERALLVKAWTGDTPHTYDRAGRGSIEVKRLTLSLVGGFQPARLLSVVRDAQGEGADGLLARFQMSVWPDPIVDRVPTDKAPDHEAAARVCELFSRTYSATRTGPAMHPLRFCPEAQFRFDDWAGPWLQVAKMRPPTIQSHLVKMQRTIAGLALIFEFMLGPSETVSVGALDMALSWAPFLAAHAERIHSVNAPAMPAAAAILARRAALPERFSARDIYRAEWSGLARTATETGLADLVRRGYLGSETCSTGGRPSRLYFWLDRLGPGSERP